MLAKIKKNELELMLLKFEFLFSNFRFKKTTRGNKKVLID